MEKYKCRDQVVKAVKHNIVVSRSVAFLVGGWRLKMQPLLLERAVRETRCMEPPLLTLENDVTFSSPNHHDSEYAPQQHRIDRGRGRSAKRRWEHLRNLSSHHSRHAQMLCMQSSAAAGFPFVARAVAAPIRPRIPAN